MAYWCSANKKGRVEYKCSLTEVMRWTAERRETVFEGAVVEGLFHKLGEPINGQDIGVAESYVTSATCFELSGIPVICAFSSGNLPVVAKDIRSQYPMSRLIIFADNDRHLEKNVGILAAEKAVVLVGSNSLLAFPEFGAIPASQDASDWNDLVRLVGVEVTRFQYFYQK